MCVTTALPAGTDTLSASYSGDLAYTPSTNSITDYPVALGQTITFESSPPAAAVVGSSYAVTATGGASGQPVVLSVDTTSATTCSISNGTVTFRHVGTCTVDADQAGTTGYNAAPQAQQTITVGKAAQTVAFTSPVPSASAAVVGARRAIAATGGASGNPVTFSVAPATTNHACTVSGTQVSFAHPGNCVIAAGQAGTGDYDAAAPAIRTIPVSAAATATTLAVKATTVTARVAVTAPGTGTPAGTVTFRVGPRIVGTAALRGGTATLAYRVPAGTTRSVSAAYGGSTDYTASSASTSRHDPTIRATVTSSAPDSRYGWYRGSVTVTFHCTANGAPLAQRCPAAVRLTHSGAAQSVTRTVTAADGGIATVSVRGISVDNIAPHVSVSGIANRATYAGTVPTVRCVAKDTVSGLRSCTITRHTSGTRTTYTAVATDRAGNTARTSGSYRTLAFYVQGATYRDGTFSVRAGHTYTMVVTAAGLRPIYYDARVFPHQPAGRDAAFHAAGKQRWTLRVTFTRNMRSHPYWNVGAKVGRTMRVVRLHVS